MSSKTYILIIITVCFFQWSVSYCQYFPINQSGKWGFIDYDGKIVISPQYENAGFYNDQLASVMIKNKWGFIDSLNNFIIKPQYDFVSAFSCGVAITLKKDSVFLINKKGKVLFRENKNKCRIENFYNDLGKVYLNDKANLIDTSGNFYFNKWFDDIGEGFSEGLLPVKSGEFWGQVDSSSQVIIPFKYDYLDSYHDGLALVKVDTLYSYINKDGELINKKFNHADFFSCGVASVSVYTKDNRFLSGVIDYKGDYIIQPKYDYIGHFYDNKAVFVNSNNKYGYISNKGKVILDSNYDFATNFINEYTVIQQGNWQYLINSLGEKVVGPYKKVYHLFTIHKGMVIIVKEGSLEKLLLHNDPNIQYAYVDLKGEIKWKNW